MKIELKRWELICIKIALKHAKYYGTPHNSLFQDWTDIEKKINEILNQNTKIQTK